MLGLIIRTDGKVCRVRILKGSGFGLDEKTVEAVKSWVFEPAVKDGKPVAVEIAVEVNFNRLFVSPTSARVVPEGKQQFSAAIASSTSPQVKWSVSCAASACGSISDEGLYTAPSSAPTPATVTVTAVSATDPTKTASAKVDIQVNSSK